jgi:uncharacterized phiE125 gp8 family phage protein
MQLNLFAAPADEPVSLAEARQYCRVTGTDEDALLLALIGAARRLCEQKTGRQLVTQTWDVLYDSFMEADPRCRGEVWLPRSPVQSVTHVKYHDAAGVQQTWSAVNYQVAQGMYPRLAPVTGVSWPATYDRLQAVEIRVVCGYGDPADVPDDLRLWMQAHIVTWFDGRAVSADRQYHAVSHFDGLLDRESIVVVG